MNDNKPIQVLWFGTGSMTENLLPAVNHTKVEILAFIDEREEMCGATYSGSPIINFSQISDYSFDYILVACRPAERINARLRDFGIPAEKIISLDVENLLRVKQVNGWNFAHLVLYFSALLQKTDFFRQIVTFQFHFVA